jgi:hypothetical protein
MNTKQHGSVIRILMKKVEEGPYMVRSIKGVNMYIQVKPVAKCMLIGCTKVTHGLGGLLPLWMICNTSLKEN